MRILSICLVAVLALGVFPIGSQGQVPAYAAQDLSQFSTPDALWLHIQEVKKGPKMRAATAEEYRAAMGNAFSQLYAAATAFVTRYPEDLRKWDARLLQIEAQQSLLQMQGRFDTAGGAQQLNELAGEMAAPGSVRAEARNQLVTLALQEHLRGNRNVSADVVVAMLEQFSKDYPTYPSLDALKYRIAEALSQSDPAATSALLKELANSGQGQVVDLARNELATMEKLKSPLGLHFTAADGSQVDIANLRGKVVLVDFWATWCGPCRAEIPEVVDTYKKLHDKGFEVIGISLDQDRDKMVNFAAQNGMTWPQYFDGRGWNNSISSSFGIHSIPTMWLVNKSGYVVTAKGRGNLASNVEKLLAE